MENKKLYRSKNSKMVCGVCGGIGEYFKIDPTIVRLLWVLFTFASFGFALVAYFAAAVIIPDVE